MVESREKSKWTPLRISVEMVGWLGAIFLLTGYYLIQTKKVKHNDMVFILLNIIGAFLLLINTIYHRAYPSALANLVWVGIGSIVAIRLLLGYDGELE